MFILQIVYIYKHAELDALVYQAIRSLKFHVTTVRRRSPYRCIAELDMVRLLLQFCLSSDPGDTGSLHIIRSGTRHFWCYNSLCMHILYADPISFLGILQIVYTYKHAELVALVYQTILETTQR